jgi:hypothetical protein
MRGKMNPDQKWKMPSGGLHLQKGFNEGLFTSFEKGRMPMERSATQLAVTLAGVLVLVATTVLPLQPVFGEGGARRDVVRQAEQNRKDAVEHAKEAVDQGKQGQVEALLAHAEAALQHALKGGQGGQDQHLDEGITHLKEAIEHGKAGHADVATKHAETAVMHLSAAK